MKLEVKCCAPSPGKLYVTVHHGLQRSVLPQYILPGSPTSALVCQQGRPISTPKCRACAVRSARPSIIVSDADLVDWLEASQVCDFRACG